jgi:hypothetical protein
MLKPDAPIFTLNTVRKTERPFAPQLSLPRFLADSCAAAYDVLKQAEICYIVVMSSTTDTSYSSVDLPWLSKAFMGWTNVKFALQDHNYFAKEIRETKME